MTASLIVERDLRCVVCGGPARDKHHRRRRRVDHDGLAHTAANGILACGLGGSAGCHGEIHRNPTWAQQCGYIVSSYANPLEVPVLHFQRGLILLDSEGGWSPAAVPGVSVVGPADL